MVHRTLLRVRVPHVISFLSCLVSSSDISSTSIVPERCAREKESRLVPRFFSSTLENSMLRESFRSRSKQEKQTKKKNKEKKGAEEWIRSLLSPTRTRTEKRGHPSRSLRSFFFHVCDRKRGGWSSPSPSMSLPLDRSGFGWSVDLLEASRRSGRGDMRGERWCGISPCERWGHEGTSTRPKRRGAAGIFPPERKCTRHPGARLSSTSASLSRVRGSPAKDLK